MTTCRFVATDQPRMLRTHVRDCNASGCEGCMPCNEDHCETETCGRHTTPPERFCPSCVGDTRQHLRAIQRLQRNMLGEAIIRGVNSMAAMLAGPIADIAGTHEQRACRCPGLTCPDIADRIGPAHQDCKHESCRWITGWARRCPAHRTWEADNYDEPHALKTLGDWDEQVRILLNQPTTLKLTVERAVDYLCAQLTELARRDDFAWEELARDVRQCRGHLEDVLRDGDKGEQTRVPCLDCGTRLVCKYADAAASDHHQCPSCRRRYDAGEFARAKAEWLYEDEGADRFVPIGDACAATGRPEFTVRTWLRRGTVGAVCDIRTHRLLVWWPDVRSEHRDRELRDRRKVLDGQQTA